MLKTKKFRRLLAGLLAVLMLSVCLPVGAFAADEATRAAASTFVVRFMDAVNGEVKKVGPITVGYTGDFTYASFCEDYADKGVKVPDGYELAEPDKHFNLTADTTEVKVAVKQIETEEPAASTFTVSFVDAVNGEVKKVGPITVGYTGDFTYESFCEDYADKGVKVPAGYELAEPDKHFNLTADTTEVKVAVKQIETEEPAASTFTVSFVDAVNGEVKKVGPITVGYTGDFTYESFCKDYNVAVPAGYELVEPDTIFTLTADTKEVEIAVTPTSQTVGINYWDIINNKQAGESQIVVDADATEVNYSLLTNIPENYELVWTGDYHIYDGWIWVEVRPAERTVGLNYWDIVNNEQVAEGSVKVGIDDKTVNTSTFTDIPEGYELVWNGELQINDGWVWVEVRPIVTTKEIGVNYWDVENNVQAAEGKVVVDKDANNVSVDQLTDIPEGYELTGYVGDYQINDGWIYVEVKPVADTKVVGVNYWDVENNVQVAEGEVIVAKDANNVNMNQLTDIPEGYELTGYVGDYQINDGWIYVEVKPVPTTKTVGLNYWDIINNKQVAEGSVEVAADATNVNTSTFTDIPEGYELVWTGDLQINDGWVWVEVRPATRTVGLNYWDIVNNEQVSEGSVEVDIDATNVNTSTFTDIPEGYELVWTGDLQINDGWVWVEVRPTKTLRIFWAIDNGEQADFADGSEDMYTQELTWKHINDDITMPELAIADGYKLAGWSVSGQESEYWDASLETTNVGGRYVEDENGGIISITANIVAVTEEPTKPSDPSTGDNTTTVTGKDEHPDIAEANANGTWGAPTATPAAASTIPQTGDSMPVVMLIVIALAAAGAVGGLVVLRKRSHQ